MEEPRDEVHETLKKVEQHLAALYDLQKNMPVKKLIFRWLMALYPAVIVMLLLVIDVDHRKYVEILQDAGDLLGDVHNIMYPDQADN